MLRSMKLQRLVLSVSPFVLVACAGQTYRVDAGPMFVRARGEIALAGTISGNQNGALAGNNGLDNAMGLGDVEASPYLRVESDIDRHRVRAHGFLLDSEGSGTLGRPYGNILAGSQVQTSSEFYAFACNYGYEVLRQENLRLAVGAQIGLYGLDIAARSSGGRESVETSAVVPMPFVEAEWFWHDLTVGANLGVMSADLGDANGRYVDFEAYGNWQLDESWGLRAGYRYLVLDGYGRATSRDFDADVDMQGLFVSAGVRF